jgi:hypothetical protein
VGAGGEDRPTEEEAGRWVAEGGGDVKKQSALSHGRSVSRRPWWQAFAATLALLPVGIVGVALVTEALRPHGVASLLYFLTMPAVLIVAWTGVGVDAAPAEVFGQWIMLGLLVDWLRCSAHRHAFSGSGGGLR